MLRLAGQQFGERRGKRGALDVLAVDLDALEDALVEEAPLFGVAAPVGALGVIGQQQCQVEAALGGFKVAPQAGDGCFGCHPLAAQTFLFFREELGRDLVGVVGRQELLLLPAQLAEDALGASHLGSAALPDAGQPLAGGASDLGSGLGRQLDGGVVVLDRLLDGFDAVMGLAAAAIAPVAAEEVRVDGARAAAVAAVDQPAMALGAEDRSNEVMVVLP